MRIALRRSLRSTVSQLPGRFAPPNVPPASPRSTSILSRTIRSVSASTSTFVWVSFSTLFRSSKRATRIVATNAHPLWPNPSCLYLNSLRSTNLRRRSLFLSRDSAVSQPAFRPGLSCCIYRYLRHDSTLLLCLEKWTSSPKTGVRGDGKRKYAAEVNVKLVNDLACSSVYILPCYLPKRNGELKGSQMLYVSPAGRVLACPARSDTVF